MRTPPVRDLRPKAGSKCDRRADRCAFSPVGHPKLWPFNPVLVQLCDMEYCQVVPMLALSRPGKLATFPFMAVQPPRTIKPIARIARRSSFRDFRYLLLRNRSPNIRREIYRRQGVSTAWCSAFTAHDSWRWRVPVFLIQRPRCKYNKKMQDRPGYPGMQVLAFAGFFNENSGGHSMRRLDRF